MVSDVQDVVGTALGAEPITTTVEGRERYTVAIRYPRDLRENPQAIANDVLVPMPAGGAVPLGEVAKIEPARGPTSIRTENGQLATYIYVDIRDRDLGGYVADAQQAVQASIQFPAGYYVVWSGQYEYLERATARLKIVVPVTLLIIFLLLYLNFRSIAETMIVMLSLPAFAKEVPLNVLSAYLNSLTTAEASFVQVNADGSKSKGKIYIQRPGRARFEYAAPDKNLVIAAGGQVVIFDARSNEPPEEYPLARTPLNLILAQSVNLGTAKMVVGHREVGDVTTLADSSVMGLISDGLSSEKASED